MGDEQRSSACRGYGATETLAMRDEQQRAPLASQARWLRAWLATTISGQDLSSFFDAWLHAPVKPSPTGANGLGAA